jgi:hypothetical protein
MSPKPRAVISTGELARIEEIGARAEALYRMGLRSGPSWADDPLGAAAWELRFRSPWTSQFNVDSLLAIETGRAHGLSWRELVACAGLPEDEEGRFRALQTGRLRDLAERRAEGEAVPGPVDPVDDPDFFDETSSGGMPVV